MKHIRIRLLSVLLLLALLCACAGPKTEPAPADALDGCRALLAVSGPLLAAQDTLPAGSSLSDWLAIALSLSGEADDYATYLAALEQYVTARYAQNGTLDRWMATEFHRVALAVLACGGDPTAFGTAPDGTPINLIADGIYHFNGDLTAQGLNAVIYALLALDAGGFAVPEDAAYTREVLVSLLLSQQEADGGFGLLAGGSSADITAMALQALAPYAEASDAISRAVSYLADSMTDACTFLSYEEANIETACQVVIALCALGIDPRSDARFTRGAQTIVTQMEEFRLPDGSYAHALGEQEGNLLTTEQVMLAQAAVQRLARGQRLYDFSGQE